MGLIVLILLGFIPTPAVAPIKGVSTHTIQASVVGNTGEGIRFVNDITRFDQKSSVGLEIYKQELNQSEHPEQVIRERIQTACSRNALSASAFSNESLTQIAPQVDSGLQGATMIEIMEATMAETDQETLASAVDGTPLEDHPIVISYAADGGDETIQATATSAVFITHIRFMRGRDSVTITYRWRAVGDDSWQTTAGQTLTEAGTIRGTVTELSPNTEYEVQGVATWSDGTRQTTSTMTFQTNSPDTDAC